MTAKLGLSAALTGIALCLAWSCSAQTEDDPAQTKKPIPTVEVTGTPAPNQIQAAATPLKTPLVCDGALQQGGLIVCRTIPGARVTASDGRPDSIADERGVVVFGLSRKAEPGLMITSYDPQNRVKPGSRRLAIAPRSDKVTEVRGVPCEQLDAKKRTPTQQKNIERSWLLKQDAWKSFNDGPGATAGFLQPAKGRISSKFGGYRTYITTGCETRNGRPHFGYDIAAPTGAPIIAPAGGTVTLADDDLFFEGGTVFIDHGHGLISIFLHMSKVDVELGDVVRAGELLGEIGSTGTATGPHLHWGVKYRNPNAPDRSGDFYIDPELLLELPKATE